MWRVVLSIGAMALLSGCAGRVILPHRTLSYQDACPGFDRIKCRPDDGRSLVFNLSPPVLEINDRRPAYHLFIGRAFPDRYIRGQLGRYCGDGVTSLFDASHFESESATGTFVYSYKLRSTLSARVEADLVEAAIVAGLPPQAADAVTASARAAYNRAKNREVVTSGVMRIVRLKSDTLAELRFGNGQTLAPCREFLARNPDYRIVKAMTVFQIQRSNSDTQITSDISADIKGSVTGVSDTQLASVNAAIDRSVSESIQTALSDRYLVWAVTWFRPEDP